MPSPEVVQKALEAIKRTADYEYFFEHLESPDWIKPLWDAGMFRSPYKPVPKGRYVSFPFWPESQYLARMAAFAPETVLEIALQIPDTENVRVHEDLAEIARAIPADLAVKFLRKTYRWIESPYQMVLPKKLGTLVAHLALGGQVDAALKLARALLAVLPDPRLAEKAQADESHQLLPAPRARFDVWDYGEILKKHVPDLVATAGRSAVTLLCDLLEDAVRLSRHSEDEGPQDHSYIWRPAIEDHTQSHSYGLRNVLVSAVRNAAEQLARANPATVPALVSVLEKRPWEVFKRLALHILRVFADAAPELAADRLIDRARFDKLAFRHEYTLLLQTRFAHLTSTGQAKILGWIDEGPNPEEYKATVEQVTGRRPTNEEFTLHAKYWRRDWMARLNSGLPAEWRQRYEELVAELGPAEHPEFPSYVTSWHGPTSPKAVEDLRSMSFDEIVAFLGTWQPSGEPMSPSREGLGRQLTALIASEPERFAAEACRFQELDPTYVRALISGLRDATGQGRHFAWPPVLALCRWIVGQPREIPGRNSEYADLDPGWVWTRKAIADLLSVGFKDGPAGLPFDLRPVAWAVLLPLTNDPDPTPEHEARYGGSNMDPATLSINTTRGESMHAVVRYALWVRRHTEELVNGKERVKLGFDEMPEVREVLDRHLIPEDDPALAVRSVYGQWFPWLVLLDSDWAAQSVVKIFPREENLCNLRDAAWETYIIFCDPRPQVFDLLREEYFRAIERLGEVPTDRGHLADPDQHLAEHLMTLYWYGQLNLDEPESLLTRFYMKASDALREHAIAYIGRSLYNTKGAAPPKILHQLKALWETRINEARSATPQASYTAELSAFGWWFASAKFDDTWAIAQLKQVLLLAHFAEPDHLVIERLALLAAPMPGLAVECLRLMVEGDKEGWNIYGWRKHARAILSTALQSTDGNAREAAVDLVHRLGARSLSELRDLIEERPAP